MNEYQVKVVIEILNNRLVDWPRPLILALALEIVQAVENKATPEKK